MPGIVFSQPNGSYDFLEKRMPSPLRMTTSQDHTPYKGCLCPFSSRIELVTFQCPHRPDFAITSNAYFQSIVAYATNSEFRELKNCGFHRMGPIELYAIFPRHKAQASIVSAFIQIIAMKHVLYANFLLSFLP